MQRKTIKNNISNKMESWVSSIKDPKLAENLKDNIIVTGGCITSMLLNEPVNDYDIYLQDMNVVKRIAEYYINESGQNVKLLDGREKADLVAELEKDYDLTPIVKINSAYAVSLRNLKDDQIKLYFPDSKSGFRVEYDKSITQEVLDTEYKVAYFSPNAISLHGNVQIVLRFHGTPKQVHETYDFIHATNYFTFEDGVVLNLAALESIITKQLKYSGSHYPVTSIIRAKKFIKRGFNINAREYLKIMFQISALDLTNTDVLEEQLIGVDVAYFSLLIDILRGKYDSDPDFTLSSAYLNELIDRVFSENSSED